MGENNGSGAIGCVLCKDECCKPLYYESIVNVTTRSYLWGMVWRRRMVHSIVGH